MPHDHAIPQPRLAVIFLIYVVLMLLLAATVAAAELESGPWSTAVALSIAALKAVLILLFFMHVWYSQWLDWIVAFAAFFWLAILLELTLSDYLTRAETPNIQPMTQGASDRSAAELEGSSSGR